MFAKSTPGREGISTAVSFACYVGRMRRCRPWLALAPVVVGVLASACDDAQQTDSRFATPERTVETLLGAYGIADTPQETVRARLAEHGGLELVDTATWRACFVDLDQPGGEGMAGYVLGMLAAARDELRYETIGERGFVIPREGIRVVMLRGDDGAYRILLAESVPDEVRRGLLTIEDNARHRVPTPGP